MLLYHCCVSFRCCGNMFAEPLTGNGSGIFAYLAVVAYERLHTLQYLYELVGHISQAEAHCSNSLHPWEIIELSKLYSLRTLPK
jgi:hypothetical protein